MIYNFKLTEQARCSQKEKYQCIELVERLVDFSERARREGLLCLEDEIENIKDPFFKMGLQLVIDGTDPDCIKDIMNNKTCFGGYKGKSLLEKLLITTGILSVQAGDNPRIVQEKLFSILRGIDRKIVYQAIEMNKSGK